MRMRGVLWQLIAMFLAQTALGDPGQEQNYLGINIGTVLDWEGNIVFADAMKSAREWCTPDNTWTLLPANELDAQGWPLVDAELIVWHGLMRDNSGTYGLSFESNGAVSVTVRLTDGSVQDVVYNAGTRLTTARVVLSDPTASALCLRFSNTNGGVRNVKLMRPIAPGSPTSQPAAEDFSRPFLSAIAPFQALRFMDFMSSYGNQQVQWSDRVQPDYASFNRSGTGYSWIGKGGAWEYVIRLCNQAHKDAWICVPLRADHDYVRQLARLFRDGDSATGNAGLDPDLALYVEYGNELWNTAGDFDGVANHALAVQEHAAGDPYRYAFDSSDNDWYWAWRRVARRALDVSLIFRQEFGDASMMTRIRPVFEWQLGYTDVGLDPLSYLERAYIPLASPGRPVDYFFYGGGGSAYYSPDNASDSLTLDNIWQSEAMNAGAWGNSAIKTDAALCATFGIKRTAYEGGPGLDNTGHSESVKAQAWADTRMGTTFLEHHAVWSAWGGDLLAYYTLRPNDYQWGFFSAIDNLNSPKFQAASSLASETRAPLAHFKEVPGVTPGIQFDLSVPGWKDSSHAWYADIQADEWRSYIYNIRVDGEYGISARYSHGGGGQVALIADGAGLSKQTASGDGTVSGIATWTKGMHSVRVRATGGSLTIVDISISQQSTSTPFVDPHGPAEFELQQNYPNPFNPTTDIRFQIPEAGRVVMKLFDVLGRCVQTLVDGEHSPGSYSVQLNGAALASGVYIYRLEAGKRVAQRKLMLLK